MKIINFGNDVLCGNSKELKKLLIGNYQGMSVAVHFERPSGIKRVVFIDVPQESTSNFVDSYSRSIVDFDEVISKLEIDIDLTT